MARLSQELIDQVRQSVDIADVISQDVQLQRQGKNLVGHCPFHEDNTPSFSVSEQKQFFYCFSCHRSGSVFDFLMELHHLSFPQAVEQVAKLGSVALPTDFQAGAEPKTEQAPDSQQGRLIKLHETTMRLYHHILMNTPAGEPARRYLQKRGLTQEQIDQFNLGYAPKEEVLKAVLEKEGHDYQLLRRSGLFTEDRSGSLHDRFHDRVMFPLKDGQGRPVAFSGRLLQKKTDAPKYLNSPETPIFNKRCLIFNFDLARKAARENGKLLLFEGYMDVISAYGAGVHNGIASMGTSLTDEQLAMIVKTTAQLNICYDGDAPGQNAIERAERLLLTAVLHDYGTRAQLKAMPDFAFVHDQYQELYQQALNYFTEHDEYDLASFLDYVDDPALKATLTQLDGLNAAAVPPAAIDDCLRIIMQKTPLTQKIAQAKLALQEAKARSDHELITQLTIELIQLYSQQQRLKTEETS